MRAIFTQEIDGKHHYVSKVIPLLDCSPERVQRIEQIWIEHNYEQLLKKSQYLCPDEADLKLEGSDTFPANF